MVFGVCLVWVDMKQSDTLMREAWDKAALAEKRLAKARKRLKRFLKDL
jgi:hypothetical protein